jgi:hypothetical protein
MTQTPPQRVALLCPCCSSSALAWDTTCYWDIDKQQYVMSDSGPQFDSPPVCGDCGAEGRAVKFPLVNWYSL